MKPSVRVVRVVPLAAVALATGLASCGGGGGDDDPPAAAPIPPLSTTSTDISGTAGPVGADYWGDNSAANGGRGETIDGIPCRQMDETYHIHSHLAIVLNGQLLRVPNTLGFVASSNCYYQIHNHDAAGRLHVESPTPVTYTLGSFFRIWGQPLSRSNVAGITGLPVDIFVTDNGVVTRHEGDPAAIELRSRRLITIQIGSPLAAIPNFVWSGT